MWETRAGAVGMVASPSTAAVVRAQLCVNVLRIKDGTGGQREVLKAGLCQAFFLSVSISKVRGNYHIPTPLT